MQHIKRELGDRGTSAAYRLLEVMTERCGSGDKFDPVLKLVAPTDTLWLGREILSPKDEPEFSVGPIPATLKETDSVLSLFAAAGLIELGQIEIGEGMPIRQSDGTYKTRKEVVTTIQLKNFEGMLDEWTFRRQQNSKKYGKKFKGKRNEINSPKS